MAAGGCAAHDGYVESDSRNESFARVCVASYDTYELTVAETDDVKTAVSEAVTNLLCMAILMKKD